MKITILLLALLTTSYAFGKITDVASGNHHTYILSGGVVYSAGEDLFKATSSETYIGGKLGRPIDPIVLPDKDIKSVIEQARYNPSFEPVMGLEGLEIINIASGQNDGAAVCSDGRLYMWGPNSHGQLGIGSKQALSVATQVPLPEGVKVRDVVIGNAHTLALTHQGEVYGWGLNRSGVLGLGDKELILEPTLLEFNGTRIQAIATGQNTHSMFLSKDGQIYMCGRNVDGVLGLEEKKNARIATPQKVETAQRFRAIGVGVKTAFAIDEQGRLYAWGDGSRAHFARTDISGLPELSDIFHPTLLSAAPGNLQQVVAGSRQTVVLDNNGDVYSWGIHTILSGQLGIGQPSSGSSGGIAGKIHTKPKKIPIGDSKATFIESVTNNVFVITEANRLLAWGQTAHGRLGDTLDAAHTATTLGGKIQNLAYEPVEITLEGIKLQIP